jgi:hypothetical protein
MSNAEQGPLPGKQCTCPQTQHHYSASAYGFAGEVTRPVRLTIPTQASAVLGADGGQGNTRIQDYKFDSFVSVGDTRTEVGGSYDECHGIHATYAFSALENVNVADVLIADQIVSRLYIYTYTDGRPASYSITGSHFENLKIAGHKVDVKWATSQFTAYETFSKVKWPDSQSAAQKTVSGVTGAGDWMVGSELAKLEEKKSGALAALEDTYHALRGMTGLIDRWKKKDPKQSSYVLSPANQLEIEGHENLQVEKNDWASAGIQQFGNIICIPKFGVIRLAELLVHEHFRSLIMFRVQLCSGHSGSLGGGGTSGGGGSTVP